MRFPSSGLGRAYNNFSTNLHRLRNLRQRMAVMHDHAAEVFNVRKDEFASMVKEAARSQIGMQHLWWGGEDAGLALAADTERLEEEERTTRELMLAYLISILDVFFGQWGAENKLGTAWPSATPSEIEAAWRRIAHKRRDKTKALKLTPQSRDRLVEFRERRAVIVHRGGIADTHYCTATRKPAVLGNRLLVDDGYLDGAVTFVDELVGAMAARVCTGPEAARHAPNIAKLFV